jgi:Terpene synthase family 2, C-terminal metal binding
VAAGRVRQAIRDYLFAAGWEAAIRAGQVPPPPTEYRVFRHHFGLFVVNLEFIEHSPRTRLTDQDRDDPRIRDIGVVACDLMCGINDMCSVQFERAHDNVFSPVTARDPFVAQAHTLVEIRNSTSTEPGLHAYCVAVCQFVAGTIWWHQRVRNSRYRLPPQTSSTRS